MQVPTHCSLTRTVLAFLAFTVLLLSVLLHAVSVVLSIIVPHTRDALTLHLCSHCASLLSACSLSRLPNCTVAFCCTHLVSSLLQALRQPWEESSPKMRYSKTSNSQAASHQVPLHQLIPHTALRHALQATWLQLHRSRMALEVWDRSRKGWRQG